MYEAIQVCIDLLKDRCGTLKFGRYKRTILKNIALSLIGTFPILRTPGHGDERFARLYDLSGGKEKGPVFNRYTHEQKRMKHSAEQQQDPETDDS